MKYHGLCRTNYQRIAERCYQASQALLQHSGTLQTAEEREWHTTRQTHAVAFSSVVCFVEDYVIGKKQVYQMVDVLKHYEAMLFELKRPDLDINSKRLE